MLLSRVSQSEVGPVRKNNEDYVAFWQPDDIAERNRRGAIMVMADGVGGQANGEVASKMAAEMALTVFQETDPRTPAKSILKSIFERANLAVYDLTITDRKIGKMATTLSVAIFRDREVTLAHVGDTRIYLVRHEEIQKLTHDHSYTGLQVKLRLISEHEARASTLRSVLTRSIGTDPVARPEFKRMKLLPRDRFIQCTDGLYCFMNDSEIAEGGDRLKLGEICPYLVDLALQRGTDDNLSVQVVEVDRFNESVHDDEKISILKSTRGGGHGGVTNELQPDFLLDGRFVIEEVVSRSGMASIYKARDLHTGNTAAIKIPYMQLESDPGSFSRFQREAEIGKLLNHPSILRFLDVKEQSRPYIATEFVEGETLSQIMQETRPLPLADARKITSKICSALAHMHEHNVVHRDLKPQNIMVCTDGSLRIIDFGIAKAGELRRLTFAGFSPTFGTPDYMAPEQVKGKRGDERTDIYSLGAVLYEMCTGSVPFGGDNPFIVMNSRLTGDPIAPRERNPAISEELEEIILHAMERDPNKRYASADAMKAEVDEPEWVKVTGRAKRLQAPKLWKTKWHGMRLVILSALIPILLFLLALLLTHLPRGHHH